MSQDFSVVVMAAGKGTRMKSELPKVLHPLCGRTLLGHAMKAAADTDPRQVIVVVRHDRDSVAAHAQEMNPEVIIADQDQIPGTGRAVQCGLDQTLRDGIELGGTVVVTSGDVPLLSASTLSELVSQHLEEGAAVTLATAFPPDPHGYGRVLRDPDDPQRVSRIVEQKDASPEELEVRETNAGIYAFDTQFLLEALGSLGTQNAQGEVYLTDVVSAATAAGLKSVPFVLQDTWEAQGCNDLVQLAELRDVLTARLAQNHMLSGVRIEAPNQVSIDVQAVLEPDCVILPGSRLLGNTVVETGASVGPCTTLDGVRVGAGARVPHSHLTGGAVPAGAHVPAFTAAVDGS